MTETTSERSNIDAASTDAPARERTGSTRAAVPAALRAHRRTRRMIPLSGALVAAAMAGGVLLPIVGSPAAAHERPTVAELREQNAQVYSQAELGAAVEQQLAAGSTGNPGATGDAAPAAAPAAAGVVRDGVSVTVDEPEPSSTPESSESSSESGSSDSSASGDSNESSDSSSSGISPDSYIAPAGEAQEIAHGHVMARGWGEDQFTCLVKLWNRESGWNVTASNPYSGAYGIPQALPGSKMSSHGSDWDTNADTQIRWGLDYIAGRYGNPCGAWGHSESVGWY